MLEIGSMAPDFTLLNQDGKEISLKDYRGKKVVLYFYSKDNTPGCSKQACGYRDNYQAFITKGVEVIGISKDSVALHKKFQDKYELPFTLLSNPNLDVLMAYDVWKEKKMYGKTFMGVVRSTYLIDENGVIVNTFSKVNAAKDADNMKQIVEDDK